MFAFNIFQFQFHHLAEKLYENITFLSSVSCCLRKQDRSVTQGNGMVESIAVELTKLLVALFAFIHNPCFCSIFSSSNFCI